MVQIRFKLRKVSRLTLGLRGMTSGILQDNSHFRMIDRSGKIIIKKTIPGEKKSSLSLNKCMISKEIIKHYFLMITVHPL